MKVQSINSVGLVDKMTFGRNDRDFEHYSKKRDVAKMSQPDDSFQKQFKKLENQIEKQNELIQKMYVNQNYMLKKCTALLVDTQLAFSLNSPRCRAEAVNDANNQLETLTEHYCTNLI